MGCRLEQSRQPFFVQIPAYPPSLYLSQVNRSVQFLGPRLKSGLAGHSRDKLPDH
jgi:hypothetical protein